jgi:hypothetical protein
MKFLIFAFGFEEIDFDGALHLAHTTLSENKLPPSVNYANYFLATISDGLSLRLSNKHPSPVAYLLGNFIENPTNLDEESLIKKYINYLSVQTLPLFNLFKTFPYKVLIQDVPDINIADYLDSLEGKPCCIKFNLIGCQLAGLSGNDIAAIIEDEVEPDSMQNIIPITTLKM